MKSFGNTKSRNRMVRSMQDGWIFGAVRLCPYPSRNSIHIWAPGDDGFCVHKYDDVNSESNDWLTEALNAAGVSA